MKLYKLAAFAIVSILIFTGCDNNKDIKPEATQQAEEIQTEEVQPKEVPSEEVQSEETEKIKMVDFTLTNNKGEEVSFSDFEGKIVVLNFWASWCPYCVEEMEDFQKLYDDSTVENSDFVILMLNQTDGQRETKEIADKYMVDHNLSMPSLYDEGQVGQGLFGLTGLPSTIIIDKDGYIVDYTPGKTTYEDVQNKIKNFQ